MAVDYDHRGLDIVTTRISSGVPAAQKKTAEQIRDLAIKYCPVSEDGPSHGDKHLYETIRVVGVNQYATDVIAGDEERDHAPPVEFGTYKMPAQPFMGPAAEEGMKLYIANVRDAIV